MQKDVLVRFYKTDEGYVSDPEHYAITGDGTIMFCEPVYGHWEDVTDIVAEPVSA
jgi:hypothetical protein